MRFFAEGRITPAAQQSEPVLIGNIDHPVSHGIQSGIDPENSHRHPDLED